jgi:N-acetylglucosaminyl-diphospho-decaprenol L-rhamnosyltransferase
MSAPLDHAGDVSVAIVHYRTPEVLKECLRSFEEHRPRRVAQVIVVDNSASEVEHDVASEFPWVDYIPNRENVHYRRANNQAAMFASHSYVFFLNPDTLLADSDSIAWLADVLDTWPDVGMVGPMLKGDDGLLAPQGQHAAELRDLIIHRPRGGANPFDPKLHVAGRVETLTAAALMCRRDEFLAVDGFDERAHMYWEEAELTRKFARVGQSAYYLPNAFLRHRWRKGGTESNVDVPQYFEESRQLYYEQFFGLRGRLAYRAVAVGRQTARRVLRR